MTWKWQVDRLLTSLPNTFLISLTFFTTPNAPSPSSPMMSQNCIGSISFLIYVFHCPFFWLLSSAPKRNNFLKLLRNDMVPLFVHQATPAMPLTSIWTKHTKCCRHTKNKANLFFYVANIIEHIAIFTFSILDHSPLSVYRWSPFWMF